MIATPGLSRRSFLARVGGVAAAAAAAPYIVPSSVFGATSPSNRITMGFVGIGGQGSGHLKAASGLGDVTVLAVCDVDSKHRDDSKAVVEKAYTARSPFAGWKGCDAYNDFREVMARKDIDAILCATPDHWHTIVSLAAIRAGKDVYCEKPLTLTIAEGRLLADTAQRYGRILQTGSQQRSGVRFRQACELVRNGRLGKVHTVRVKLPGNNSGPNENFPEMPVPPGFDYNLWLGQAPWAPYTANRCHYKFRFILDYSGGQTTNFGAHDIDIAQWGLGMDDSGPVEVDGSAAEMPRDGLYTVPNKYNFVCTYASGVKLYVDGIGSGVRFEGDQGWVAVNRGKIESSPANLVTSVIGPGEIHLYDSRNHLGNFLECVRTRRTPICPAEVGHRSATVCHLGTMAMVLRRAVKWDPVKEQVVGDSEAQRMVARAQRAPWVL